MKVVYMIVKGSGYSTTEEKRGKYITKMYYYSKNVMIHSDILEGDSINTTSNRMIITGIIEGIKVLNEPYEIRLKTHSAFGYRMVEKFKEKGKPIKGVNKDLIEELMKEIDKGKHELKVTITDISI